MSAVGSLRVEPPQTRVSFRPYGAEDDEWRYIGETPIENVRLPRGVFQWRLERDGFEPRLLAATNPSPLLENLGPPEFRGTPLGIQLSGAGEDEMIHVPGGAFPSPLAGLNLARVALDPFYIGRYEVTNEAFQEFVDQGGYESPEYWEHLTFFRDGVELSWEQAVAEFGDSTGQPGPSTWELGDYPPGEGSYPVRGVSWYEASAYADFRWGQLPTASHWARAALSPAEIIAPLSRAILPRSNFSGDGPAPVGTYQGVGPYGTFDMAGNVREWGRNEMAEDRDRRVSLGGGWTDPEYMFTLVEGLPAFDRSPANGVRLAEYVETNTVLADLAGPFEYFFNSPDDAQIVSDEVYEVFREASLVCAKSTRGRHRVDRREF